MNRLGNIMSINSKVIADSRSIANAISFHNFANRGVFGDEIVNNEVKEFRRQQMADRALRNHQYKPLFNNQLEFKIAYIDFKQKQMSVRAERNKNFVPYYKSIDSYINNKKVFQEDDMTAV